MQRQTMVHPAGHPLAGQPNVAANVMYFAERWRALIADGSINQMPPRKRTAPTGNRVDAMLASMDLSTDASTTSKSLMGQARQGNGGLNNTENVLGRCCWNCKGFGHMKLGADGKIVCPSPIKPRPISECINALETIRRRESNRGGRRRFFSVHKRRPADAWQKPQTTYYMSSSKSTRIITSTTAAASSSALYKTH